MDKTAMSAKDAAPTDPGRQIARTMPVLPETKADNRTTIDLLAAATMTSPPDRLAGRRKPSADRA